MSARVLVLALALTLAPLAGCLSPSEETDRPAQTGSSPSPSAGQASAADASATVRDLNLSVGDRFHHEVTWQGDDVDFTYDAIVVENRTGDWLLATDNRTAAILNSINGARWITLGPLAKDGLEPQGEGGWMPAYYQLPLENGTSWERSIEYGEASLSVTFEVEHQPNASTPLGTRERFLIEAHTAEDELFLRYDLLPSLGWFSEFAVYDPAANGSLEDRREIHIHATEIEAGWTGTYLQPETEQLVGHASWLAPLGLPDPSAANPDPATTFQVGDDATHVFGYAGAWANAGASATQITDPNGTTYRYEAASPSPDGTAAGTQLLADAVAGTWHVETAGAGAAAGGWAFLWSVIEEKHTLE